MATFGENIPVRIRESLEKAGLDIKQILLMSESDLRNLVDLNNEDIKKVKIVCAEQLVANKFLPAVSVNTCFLTTGCKLLDKELGGGYVRGAITEISGESGTGKTQFCLQASLSVQLPLCAGGANAGAVYICTEDTFPSSRLQQLLQLRPGSSFSSGDLETNRSDNIFIEHIPDAESLQNCILVRLPNLLGRKSIGLIVLDSIAGAFRSDYDLNQGAANRAEVLKSIGQQFYKFANTYNLAIICVNQVTTVPEENTIVPALGLAWANLVTTRLVLHRKDSLIQPDHGKEPVVERSLEVGFCPYLPAKRCSFIVTDVGVQGVNQFT